MTRDELPSIITAEQGCAFLGISRSVWYELDKAGDLPTHRLPPLPGTRVARWCGDTLRKFGTAEDIRRRTRAALKGVA